MLIPRLADLATRAQSLPVPVVQSGRLLGLVDAEEILAILELEDEFGLFERGAVAVAEVASRESGPQAVQRATDQLPS
jgi:Mg/Co/Ni transporter MgtE